MVAKSKPATATVHVAQQRKQKVPPADPCAMVILGAAGDLTKRLVVPALYNLLRSATLPEHFALIGVDLADGTAESWAGELRAMLEGLVANASTDFHGDKIDEAAWRRLTASMVYIQGDLTTPVLYEKIAAALGTAEQTHATQGNAIFYLAVADRFFGTVVEELGRAGLSEPDHVGGKPRNWRRVVIEKPFGHDLESAHMLNAQILKILDEDQIYRIDHFLGKETVQNIMTFRFANGFFEPMWNRDRIDHVQITVAETVGVERRGKFYEATGALRDMVPNHVFSLLAMVAMEPPTGFDAKSIRDKKADLFVSIPPLDAADVVRGQYAAGAVQGKTAVDYRQEPNVAPDSNVETYVAMRIEVDNWRWAGVPFFIRTGKHMSLRKTEIAIRFKSAPFSAFQHTRTESLPPNWLILSIAPEEGISLQFEVKRPGPEVELAPVEMDFNYDDWFPNMPNVGYETLLYDVMTGDPTLFMRADMVEQAWRIVQPVLDAWAAEKADFPNYGSGSAGPEAAEQLIRTGGRRRWRPLDSKAGQKS